jgi:phosphotriesterase-related protein
VAAAVIRTLTGDILPQDIGFTLSHEHVFCDFAAAAGDPDLSMTDEVAVLADLGEARRRGVEMLVEVSTYDMGAAVDRVARLCRGADVQVVKSTGWYRSPALDPVVACSTAQEMADRAIADIRTGFADSNLRAGVIGEIAISGTSPTPAEQKALDGAAAAALATGVGVVAHSDDWANALTIIDELTARGVDRRRIMLAHCRQLDPLEGLHELAAAGMTLAFDQLGHPKRDPVAAVAERISELISLGCGPQLVVSADVGRHSRLRSAGGSGYVAGVFDLFSALKARGLGDEAIDNLTHSAPASFLAFADPAVSL